MYSNKIPSIGPKRFRKLVLDDIEDMRERFNFSCHIVSETKDRGYKSMCDL